MDQSIQRLADRTGRLLCPNKSACELSDEVVAGKESILEGTVDPSLALVLWNFVASEIIDVPALRSVKDELLNGICDAFLAVLPPDNHAPLQAADDDSSHEQIVISDLLKTVIRSSIQNFRRHCMSERAVCDSSENIMIVDQGCNLIKSFLDSQDLSFSELGDFVEFMLGPLATRFVERCTSGPELRTGLLYFQYVVRRRGDSFHRNVLLLASFILRYMTQVRRPYRRRLFPQLYEEVATLVVHLLQYEKQFVREMTWRVPSWALKYNICSRMSRDIFSVCYHQGCGYGPWHSEVALVMELQILRYSPESVLYRMDERKAPSSYLFMEPWKFESYHRMEFLYSAWLELLEEDHRKGLFRPSHWDAADIWFAFQGYLRERKQRGDDTEAFNSRIINLLAQNSANTGGIEELQNACIRARIIFGSLWPSEPPEAPGVDAETQTDNDLINGRANSEDKDEYTVIFSKYYRRKKLRKKREKNRMKRLWNSKYRPRI